MVFVGGEILSKDATSLTLKMQDGSTKIVLISPSTQVMKNTEGTADDLVVGGDGKEKTFHILGSVETKPEQGVISHQSPIGSALLGCAVGETVTVKLASKEVSYTIQAIT
jgi:transcription elongation GreA/GreB family factor